MNIKIWPRKKNDKGGYACMPLKKNVPEGHDGWRLTTCPECGTGKKTDMDRCNYLSITGHSRNKGQPEEICSKYEKGKRGRKSGKRKV